MGIKRHEEGNKYRLNEGEKYPLAAPESAWDEAGIPTEGWSGMWCQSQRMVRGTRWVTGERLIKQVNKLRAREVRFLTVEKGAVSMEMEKIRRNSGTGLKLVVLSGLFIFNMNIEKIQEKSSGLSMNERMVQQYLLHGLK